MTYSERDYRTALAVANAACNEFQRAELRAFLEAHREHFVKLEPLHKLILVQGFLVGLLNIPT